MVKENKEYEFLVEKVQELKKARNALILAHNYQIGEVQDVADYVGDSFELSRIAAKTDAEVLVFCGVKFMAESAKILSPNKKVLLPVKDAGCPLADMANVEKIKEMRKKYPGAAVVAYVNSSAAVKAESDICCTSSNAVKVVNSLKEDTVIFLPDKNLGSYVARHTNKKIILWDGYCPVHNSITIEDVKKAKNEHPDAEFLIHPECQNEVLEMCDYVGSTAGILKYAKESHSKSFVVGTEKGIIHRLKKENPDKKFYPLQENFICPDMKKITLKDVVRALEKMEYEVEINGETRKKAYNALERMLKLSK